MTADSASIRRFAGLALVTGLSCAAAAAVLALVTGSFDETDTRVILTSIGFVLLLAGLWSNMDEWGGEDVWRAFGVVAVLGVAGSHACVMLGAMRRTDGEAIRLLTLSSVGLSAFDTLAVIAPLLELVDEVDEAWARIFGAALVLLVLTSVLPPILRRMQPAAAHASGGNGKGDPASDFFATAVIQIADKIELLNSDPGNRTPEIDAEVKRLRQLARSFES